MLTLSSLSQKQGRKFLFCTDSSRTSTCTYTSYILKTKHIYILTHLLAQVEFPQPDRRQKRLVFQVATSKMNLADEVDCELHHTRSVFVFVDVFSMYVHAFYVYGNLADEVDCELH
jgi:hypothetical protein